MVEFELPETFTEEFKSLIPDQRFVVDQLLADGVIRSYALALDQSILWVVIETENEFEVMEIIAQMPLSDFMDPYISELYFHNSSDAVHEFSLN